MRIILISLLLMGCAGGMKASNSNAYALKMKCTCLEELKKHGESGEELDDTIQEEEK